MKKHSPGRFGVPNSVIFKRKVVEIPIHIINDSVLIQKTRLSRVTCVASKSYGFAGNPYGFKSCRREVWAEYGVGELGFGRGKMGSQ